MMLRRNAAIKTVHNEMILRDKKKNGSEINIQLQINSKKIYNCQVMPRSSWEESMLSL